MALNRAQSDAALAQDLFGSVDLHELTSIAIPLEEE